MTPLQRKEIERFVQDRVLDTSNSDREMFRLIEEALAKLRRIEAIGPEIVDSELGRIACTGSMAPCEDIMGRLLDALGLDPPPETN